MRRFVGAVALTVALSVSLLLAAGCGQQASAPRLEAVKSSEMTSTARLLAAEKSLAQTTAFANELAAALQSDVLSQSFPSEPAGGFRPSSGGTDDRFYAYISSASTSPATISFDQAQLYLGEAAMAAARQDHKPEPPNPGYERNRHHITQRLKVNPDAVVILQTSGGGADSDPSFGAANVVGVTPVSYAEFVRRFRADPVKYGTEAGYVLSYDGSGISSIVQVYFP